MNSVNQSKTSDGANSHGPNRYNTQGKDDPFGLLIKRFYDDTQKSMIDILMNDKGMSEPEATTFSSNLFNIDPKRKLDIESEIENQYTNGKTIKETAKYLLDKYGKMTQMNKYGSDNDLDPVDSVEISESRKLKRFRDF
jgi:hypothetical protein